MKAITHVWAVIGATAAMVWSFPGVQDACHAFLAAHATSAGWAAFAALVAALYHNPVRPGGGL
jgi:hypothetical protein